MKLSKPLAFVLVAIVALIGVRFAITSMNAPDDQKLIEQALEESIKASKEGRPGGVMDKLSANLKVNDLDTSGNRSQIAQYIKNSKPDVRVVDMKAVITGDEARIVSPVDLELNLLGQKMSRQIPEVTMIFRKENDREYLIFPTRKWKLAEVLVPDDVVTQFMQS